jgi:hypothetical protein
MIVMRMAITPSLNASIRFVLIRRKCKQITSTPRKQLIPYQTYA